MMKDKIKSPITLRQVLYVCLAVCCVGGIAGYAYLRTRDIAAGPIVEIHQPADGHSSSQTLMQVTGIANHIAFLTLNGRQIYTTQDGNFSEPLLLSEGSSILEVVGRDKFGRTTRVRRRVVFNE